MIFNRSTLSPSHSTSWTDLDLLGRVCQCSMWDKEQWFFLTRSNCPPTLVRHFSSYVLFTHVNNVECFCIAATHPPMLILHPVPATYAPVHIIHHIITTLYTSTYHSTHLIITIHQFINMRDIYASFGHTCFAISTSNLTFAHCSSSDSSLPSWVELKPHWCERQS